jgi:hypothetical protein
VEVSEGGSDIVLDLESFEVCLGWKCREWVAKNGKL